MYLRLISHIYNFISLKMTLYLIIMTFWYLWLYISTQLLHNDLTSHTLSHYFSNYDFISRNYDLYFWHFHTIQLYCVIMTIYQIYVFTCHNVTISHNWFLVFMMSYVTMRLFHIIKTISRIYAITYFWNMIGKLQQRAIFSLNNNNFGLFIQKLSLD